jgi:hypothetical protein
MHIRHNHFFIGEVGGCRAELCDKAGGPCRFIAGVAWYAGVANFLLTNLSPCPLSPLRLFLLSSGDISEILYLCNYLYE